MATQSGQLPPDQGASAKEFDFLPEVIETYSDVERQVARILARALELISIGRDDDFFKLGGHSMLAMKVTLSLNETFGVRIPPRRFYEGPTVQELARVIQELNKPASNSGERDYHEADGS